MIAQNEAAVRLVGAIYGQTYMDITVVYLDQRTKTIQKTTYQIFQSDKFETIL